MNCNYCEDPIVPFSNKGVVKAIKKGVATVTVKTANGMKANCKVTVSPAPKKVKLNKAKASLSAGQSLTLKALLTPTDARTTLSWTSSDDKVVTVSDKGVVKAIKKGTATVTVKTANGKKAICKVTVK